MVCCGALVSVEIHYLCFIVRMGFMLVVIVIEVGLLRENASAIFGAQTPTSSLP